ncbi:hypothetical protein PTNB29_00488 [Pyrenophora teres f. teres]|nr:hypothetical protein PTNB29_00488 [Pyrenophora teres f. teres]
MKSITFITFLSLIGISNAKATCTLNDKDGIANPLAPKKYGSCVQDKIWQPCSTSLPCPKMDHECTLVQPYDGAYAICN